MEVLHYFLVSKMNIGKTIRRITVYFALFVLVLPVAMIFIYEIYLKTVSLKIRLYAKEYLADTYDFECSVGEVNYDLLQDRYEVTVYPKDVAEVELFILYASPGKIFGDGFMEAYTEGRLKLFCEEWMKEIWGENCWINVRLYSPDLRVLPTDFSTETSLEVLLSDCKYFQKDFRIESSSDIGEEELIENLWETILFFKEKLPLWSSLNYHVAGEGKYYSVQGWFKNTIEKEDVRDNIVERECYPY